MSWPLLPSRGDLRTDDGRKLGSGPKNRRPVVGANVSDWPIHQEQPSWSATRAGKPLTSEGKDPSEESRSEAWPGGQPVGRDHPGRFGKTS